MSRTIRRKTDRFLRRPKTLQEKKMVADSLDQGVRVRAARGHGRLVDSYDEIIISARYEDIN